VRRQSERYVVQMPLEIFASGRKHAAELADLSQTGMFVHVDAAIAAGTCVHVALHDGFQRHVTSALVVHALDETDARALGRKVGVGLELAAPKKANDTLFSIAVSRLLRQHATPAARACDRRIIIATSHVRLCERLAAAFGEAGFAVGTAGNGLEAIAACLRARPDVLLVDRMMPIVDGLDVVERIVRHERLSGMPVVVMSDDAADGITAFERGAMDFVTKPFSTSELVLRVRRLVRGPRQVVFRGDLAELGLPALLTLFEQERKSGQLVLTRDDTTAWIDLEDGRIVNARSTELIADPHAVLLSLLDWPEGRFELSASQDRELPAHDLAQTVTHLLLDHARRRDEARRSLAM
jgi:DNA-binding response OmpR family regulator